jgi:hypothetical protein
MVSPAVHLFLPFGELLGDSFWEVISHLLRAVTDGPEESPLSVEFWGMRRHGFLFIRDGFEELTMVTSLFNRLWGDTGLVAKLRVAVLEDFSTVKAFTLKLKILFDHINVFIVHFVVDSGVFHEKDAKPVERGGDLLTLLLPAFCFV